MRIGIWSAARRGSAGYTFIEMLVVAAILAILATAVMPLTRVTIQRHREIGLRRALKEMRTAIDQFKAAADQGRIATLDLPASGEGYPKDLETLVEGVPLNNDASGIKLKFLRRIPLDPITGSTEWQLRSYQDEPDTTSWGGQNVFDVRTRSDARGLNGTSYKDW